MQTQPNQIYHIFNQGNNRQKIFFEERNYLYFIEKMRKHILPHADFLAYCLMPNHFHWLVLVKASAMDDSNSLKVNLTKGKQPKNKLNHSIGVVLRSYTRAINIQENRTGSLFRNHTKIKDGWIDEVLVVGSKNEHKIFSPDNDYAIQCFEYIHQNPVKAGLVKKSEDWIYSSARDYAALRDGTLCNKDLALKLLY